MIGMSVANIPETEVRVMWATIYLQTDFFTQALAYLHMSEYDLPLAFQRFKGMVSNACIELLTCTQRTCSGTAAT